MIAATVCCGLLIPKINVNSDLTRYLPEESLMKHGLDTLKSGFPDIDTNAPTIRAMFCKLQDQDSTAVSLSLEPGIMRIISLRQKDSLTLYEMIARPGTDVKSEAEHIRASYPECVCVETNANSNMPDNMVLILSIASILIFIILFLMCSSYMETVLFIVTIGLSVVMNMGTNALLPSVSMMTNTIVSVLQFVLSIDYSIILMSRFRMERLCHEDSEKAMASALRKASPSILSRSFTTIVGLLSLVFMKFKIGADIGIVLAKGVFFSLVSIYTVLPALILIFEKSIDKSTKKVFLLPTDRLSQFELRYRWALSAVFVAVFAGSFILQRRTELSYASVWQSSISDIFPPQNSIMLLYRSCEEDQIIHLTDAISSDSHVISAVSYPSIMKRKLSAAEMLRSLDSFSAMMPPGQSLPVDSSLLTEQNLRILYYGISHPMRDEKMSLEDMLSLAQEASRSGLLPEGLDPDALMRRFTPAPEPAEMPSPEPLTSVEPASADTVSAPADTVLTDTLAVSGQCLRPPFPESKAGRFTRENCTSQMKVEELAELMQSGVRNTRTIFRMADRSDGTMSPVEFVEFVNTRILGNKFMRKAISEDQIEGLALVSSQIDSVMASTPEVGEAPQVEKVADVMEADGIGIKEDNAAIVQIPVCVQDSSPEEAPAIQEETPMDRLARMMLGGGSFGVDEMAGALDAAGIKIPRDTLELMYMYYGSRTGYSPQMRLSPEEIVNYLGMNDMVEEAMGALRGPEWSMAAMVTDYPVESDSCFAFVQRLQDCADLMLEGDHFMIGESVMYNEMKEGFRDELVFLTLLTLAAIFLIVALTFRSLVIPTILSAAVMSGVFINVYVSGLGGDKMLYLAYLIVQSILMGATIDYGILFTSLYLESRRIGMGKASAVRASYKASIHTIMTSGSIMVFGPYVMSLALPDPSISSILSSLSTGALSAILVILFLLPAALTACDRIIMRFAAQLLPHNTDKY